MKFGDKDRETMRKVTDQEDLGVAPGHVTEDEGPEAEPDPGQGHEGGVRGHRQSHLAVAEHLVHSILVMRSQAL